MNQALRLGIGVALADDEPEDEHMCTNGCWAFCDCGRGHYRECKHRSCYECYLDRLSGYRRCIYCGKWHNPEFDTCFTCRPETRGRDDAAKALRQLILWRDDYTCRYCGTREGELRIDQRLVRARCLDDCNREHSHRLKDDDGLRHALLHVDHVIPCKGGGLADEWNLQVLCSPCNIAKGATWYPGCRHDLARTALCRPYFLLARSYFREEQLERFLRECTAWRAVRTWDPQSQADWWKEREGDN